MRVFAYCAESMAESVDKASGVVPLTCPPMKLEYFDARWLAGADGGHPYDLLYFKLHGLPGKPYWYGDNWVTALSAAQLQGIDLGGAVVFVANCHLVADGDLSQDELSSKSGLATPMLSALLDAGASAVIGGPGVNYARSKSVDGADLLGQAFRRGLAMGLSTATAFSLAMFRLRAKVRKDATIRDTLEFRIFTRDDAEMQRRGAEAEETERRRDGG